MRLLLLGLVVVHLALACLPGYETRYNGKCIKYAGEGSDCSWTEIDRFRAVCARDGAHFSVLRSTEEQSEMVKILKDHYNGYSFFLDIRCNFITKKWEWADGTQPTFYNFQDHNLNKDDCDTGLPVYSYPNGEGVWGIITPDETKCNWHFFCQERDSISDPDCGAFTAIGTDDADTCLMVHSGKVSRAEAEKICRNQDADLASIHGKEENDFIRRTSLGQALSEDIFIGTSLIVGSKNFSWIDGSPFDYSNFGKGSPNGDVGLCVAMDISEKGGPWSSVDCESKLPFGCTRPSNDNQQALAPSHCAVPDKFGLGDHIYSPNFPKGVVTGMTCDYIVSVPSGKMVDLEIIFFETNLNRDYLQIFDGSFDDAILYNITGSNHAGEHYFSKSSSSLRLRFAPTDGKGVRGWHLLVHALSCTNC